MRSAPASNMLFTLMTSDVQFPSVTTEHLDACLKAISGRWKLRIIQSLFRGSTRFSNLQRRTQGISKRILTHQLKELEAIGIVRRIRREEAPSVTLIEITEAGLDLIPVISAMGTWAAKRVAAPQDQEVQL